MESEARGPRACDLVYFLYALNDIKPREADGHFILTPADSAKAKRSDSEPRVAVSWAGLDDTSPTSSAGRWCVSAFAMSTDGAVRQTCEFA